MRANMVENVGKRPNLTRMRSRHSFGDSMKLYEACCVSSCAWAVSSLPSNRKKASTPWPQMCSLCQGFGQPAVNQTSAGPSSQKLRMNVNLNSLLGLAEGSSTASATLRCGSGIHGTFAHGGLDSRSGLHCSYSSFNWHLDLVCIPPIHTCTNSMLVRSSPPRTDNLARNSWKTLKLRACGCMRRAKCKAHSLLPILLKIARHAAIHMYLFMRTHITLHEIGLNQLH